MPGVILLYRSTVICRTRLPSSSNLSESGRMVIKLCTAFALRGKRGWWINAIRKIFYRIVDSLSEDELPLDAGDFRLVDRRVLNELHKFEDYQPYLRGTIATLGFDQIGISYDRDERMRGESKFSFGDLIGLALDGILNH